MGDHQVIQGLLDKLGAFEAEAERLQASLAAVQTRLMAERALADELAAVLRRYADMVPVQGISDELDMGAEQEWAERVLAHWEETRAR